MLGAGEAVQTGLRGTADSVVGNHAAHSQLHRLGRTLLHERAVLGGLEVADPTGVALPQLLLGFLQHVE